MYEPFLLIHSWTRWAVLLTALYLLLRFAGGWIRKSPWPEALDRHAWAFSQLFTLQVLFGVMLWFGTSPWVKIGLSQPSLILSDPMVGFWTVRYPITMVTALGAFHIGKSIAKRSPPELRFKRYLLALVIAFALIATAIPWPWLPFGRPFFRGF